MKKNVFNIVTILALLLTLGIASGYGQSSGAMKANIPFDFIVGETTLPSGSYTIDRPTNMSGVLRIRGENGSASAFALTRATQTRATQDEGKLVFNRYGDKYFLSKILTPGSNHGRALPKSRHELEVAASASNPATESVAVKQ